MDDRSAVVALIVLGLIALGALAADTVIVCLGQQTQPGIAFIGGTAVGALAGLVTPGRKGDPPAAPPAAPPAPGR